MPTGADRDAFLAYVRGLPAGPLFPGVNATQASAALMRFIRGLGIVDSGSVFYSWRHSVCNQLEKVPAVSRDLARHIVGHAPIDVHSRLYLHPSIPELVAAIEGLG